MGRPAIPPGGTGAVSPTQVKDRSWTVRVRWRDDTGGYHRATAEGTSKRQCEELVLARIADERQQHRASLTSGLSLDEVAERWLASLERTRRRPSTIAQYRACWRATLAPVLGEEPIDTLTRARLQQVLLDGLFARGPGHLGDDGRWVPGNYKHDDRGHLLPLHGEQPRAVMRLLLRFAADRGYRADGINPLDGTEPPERRDPVVRALTDDESNRLIAMAAHWHRTGHGASDALWHGLVVLKYTGLRVGELLALSWDDVDLDGDPPTLTARQTLVEARSGNSAAIGPTKGGTVDVIALHDDAAAVLTQRLPPQPQAGSFVFATRTGRPVTAANFRRALRDLVRGTDLSWVHPHVFRASIGTRANDRHDLEVARDLLRHKSSNVTARHYIERNNVRVLDPRGLFDSARDTPTAPADASDSRQGTPLPRANDSDDEC